MFHLLNDAVEDVQNLIKRRVPGGGTTLTLALALGKEIYNAHVGDSRLYIIDGDGQMHQKTKDHSLVKRLVDLGEITELEALVHPQRNVCFTAPWVRWMNGSGPGSFHVEAWPTMMICSDGLWGVLEHDQMQRILNRSW